MGAVNMTISLRADERVAIKERMDKYGMKQHEVIKLAIRRFLFPDEQKDIPVNGRSVDRTPPHSIAFHGGTPEQIHGEFFTVTEKTFDVTDEEAEK